MKKLAAGDKLWWVDTNTRRGVQREVTVTKVGRKWAEIDSGRFRISLLSWVADGEGYGPPGACYESKAAYDEESGVHQAFYALRQKLYEWRGKAPGGVTINDINTVRKLLRLE